MMSFTNSKTARACDSCIRKRARWFCAADDAFLCQACDSSVHSANPLARRHQRVRLKVASCYNEANNCFAPLWHKGFTKKPRTPRNGKHAEKALKNLFYVVPELCSEDTNPHEESAEQVLYRVPICTTPSSEAIIGLSDGNNASEREVLLGCDNYGVESLHELFVPSEIGIAEFGDDVESLLGKGLESECVGMEELGLVDSKEKEYSSWECCVDSGKVKIEEDVDDEVGREVTFELGFDCCDDESHAALTCEDEEEEEEKKVELDVTEDGKINGGELKESDNAKRKKISLLQLDYEAVITAWASQNSPWTTPDKPDLSIQQWWPHCLGTCGVEFHQPYGELDGLFRCRPAIIDGGREARVSRYREKRRTRLFSKKIRYEVRKLNAEKRPRMKGRFIKRASFAAPLNKQK